ncbi:glycosyltransferase family 39 protein [Candidatus Poribacteria bacterium]|nr:glycosyltransferase family 39 protein [Candidatus Poribacteria bacterium]
MNGHERGHVLLLVAAFTASAAIRFLGIGDESFWLDEVFSAQIVEGPLGEILNRIPADKPPLDYYVQALFSRCGVQEVWHRLPAAIAGSITPCLVYLWARRWHGRHVALLAFLLTAFNPMMIHFSREARPYSLFVMLMTAQQYLFCLWWRERRGGARKWKLFAALLAVSILSLYTMYSYFLVAAAEMLFLGVLLVSASDRRAKAADLGFFLGLVGCVFLAGLPLRSRAELLPPEDYYWKYGGGFVDLLIRTISNLFQFGVPASALVSATLTALLVFAVKMAIRRRHPLLSVPLFTSVLPVAAILPIYEAMDRPFEPRYVLFCVPGLCVAYAAGLTELARVLFRRKTVTRRAVTVCLTLLAAAYGASTHVRSRPHRTDWRGVARGIAREAASGDIVIVPGPLEWPPMRYYVHQREGRADVPVVQMDSGIPIPPGKSQWVINVDYEKGRRPGRVGEVVIERRSSALPAMPLETALGATGNPAFLAAGSCPEALLGPGWTAPEAWSPDVHPRWAISHSAIVFLPIREAGEGRITARFFPYSEAGRTGQTVALLLNGQALARQALPAGQFTDVSWDVPASLPRPGYNELKFSLRSRVSPRVTGKTTATSERSRQPSNGCGGNRDGSARLRPGAMWTDAGAEPGGPREFPGKTRRRPGAMWTNAGTEPCDPREFPGKTRRRPGAMWSNAGTQPGDPGSATPPMTTFALADRTFRRGTSVN